MQTADCGQTWVAESGHEPSPHLEMFAPTGGVRRVPLISPRITVGRSGDNDVVVVDKQVSRLHAVIERLAGQWLVYDVGSRNGTFVNGRRIGGNVRLSGDDEVRIGRTRLVLREQHTNRGEATEIQIRAPRLTRREHDVLIELLRPNVAGDVFVDPASVREIANRLFVTEGAVKHHLANLFEKFGITSEPERRRSHLANEALRRGAITIAEVRAQLGPEDG